VPPGSRTVVLLALLTASWFTDAIGLHTVLGAFVLGLVMPRGRLTEDLLGILEPLTVLLLVPLFFAYSGLNTSLGLMLAPSLLGMAVAVVLVACLCKGVACWLAARLLGQRNHTAMQIGALMNTRGVMELILLNIGLDRGLITPTLFSILVMMAIVTTLLTTPVFDLISRRRRVASGSGALPTLPARHPGTV
jgi:Kef-type K+ transport system membrane component KefB